MNDNDRSGPLGDPDRLMALQATALTESAPEEAFDRLTRLVQRCVRVPVALVSIVDDHRQVFKSQQGLPEPWCSLGETPLSHSFCQHVVTRDAPLVIEDARQYPLVRDNLAITDLNVIAYLGVPLRTPDGYVVGSLCAIDGAPRAWTPADLEAMEALADEAMREIAKLDLLHAEADRLDAALDRSGALVHALLDTMPNAAAVLRPDGLVVAANDAAFRLSEHPRDAVVGQPVWSALSLTDPDRTDLEEAVARAADGRTGRSSGRVGEAGRAMKFRVRPVAGGVGVLLFQVYPEA